VDKSKTEVRLQSEWFDKFTLADIIKLTSKFTVAQFLAREDFAKRYAAGQPVAITELLYPLLQAYDSVAIQADVEFGGIDQKFNCLVGRELQGMMRQRQQQVFLMPLLVGTDGVQKMSKSLGNYIAVDEPPYDMYGKVMSIPDNLIMLYYELLTDVPDEELAEMKQELEAQSVNPMDLKKRLAADIVTQFHSRDEARKADERFAREVQKKELPQRIPEFRPVKAIKATVEDKPGTVLVSGPVLLVEVGLASTGSAARQLIAQGSVDINGQTITGNDWEVTDGTVIRAGKRGWCKISLGDVP